MKTTGAASQWLHDGAPPVVALPEWATILVVEDEEAIRHVLIDHLSTHGYHVVERSPPRRRSTS